MMVLFAKRSSANSLRVAIVLEECGLDAELRLLDADHPEPQPDDFRAANPFGTVPVLVEVDAASGSSTVVRQSAAIALHLVERHGRHLMPADAARRLTALEWLMFAASDLAPANMLDRYMRRHVPDLGDGARRYLEGRLLKHLGQLESHLASTAGGFLAGALSVADIMAFPAVRVRRAMIEESGAFPALATWHEAMSGLPSVERAVARMEFAS